MSTDLFPPTTNDSQVGFDSQALAQDDLRGDFIYFLDTKAADKTWLAVYEFVPQSELYDARNSTTFTCTARGDSQDLLMVAIPNCADIEDEHRVHRLLTNEFGR